MFHFVRPVLLGCRQVIYSTKVVYKLRGKYFSLRKITRISFGKDFFKWFQYRKLYCFYIKYQKRIMVRSLIRYYKPRRVREKLRDLTYLASADGGYIALYSASLAISLGYICSVRRDGLSVMGLIVLVILRQ